MKKKLFLTSLVLLFTCILIPVIVFATDDTRIVITKIEGTSSDIDSIVGYGKVRKNPTFTLTKGEPAYFNVGMGLWEKKNAEGTWERYTDSTFKEGTYRYSVQIRTDEDYKVGDYDGTTHKLADTFETKINGKIWEKLYSTSSGPNFSYAYAVSPEYIIEEPVGLPLSFEDNESFDIKINYVGKDITSFNVSNKVSGGKTPYTFSKIQGPSWINVSNTGTITGKPTAIGNNSDLVVRVTDNKGNYKEITIEVAKTAIDPNDRINITKIEGTSSDIDSIVGYGKVRKNPTFTLTKGEPAYFNVGMGLWEKKNAEGTWERYTDSTFKEGTYRYSVQIRTDEDYKVGDYDGTTHKLADTFETKVNGKIWEKLYSTSSGPNFSYAYAVSPEYTIVKPQEYIVTFNTNGGSKVESQLIPEENKVIKPTDPQKTGYKFAGWFTDSAFATLFDFTNTKITKNTTIYAKWTNLTNTYKVTYKDYDGKVLKTENVEEGKNSTPPVNPTREGYVFLKWDKNFSNITSNIIITAEYRIAVPTTISYKAHVESIGWQDFVKDGQIAGTTGKSLRTEALQLKVSSEYSGGIQYKAHVENIGWQNFVKDGEIAGTTGKSLRIEALQLKLYGEISNYYDIYYRVHVQDYGWLDWAKNGESAGSTGNSKRMEAVEIQLVKKGEKAPGNTNNKFIPAMLEVEEHIENIGWQNSKKVDTIQSSIIGTTGQALRLEAIKINLLDTGYTGGIQYKTHVQNIGWQDFVKDGQIAGTTGKGLRLEAIQIQLYGEIANHFDIYYRAHVQNIGWQDFGKNGDIAGTTGKELRLEALEIKLVKK